MAVIDAGKDGKCRILVNSGGGDRIFFEFGALTAFHYLYPDPVDIQYDVVTGISAGSLMASMLSRFEIGNEVAALKKMNDILFSIHSRPDIIADWPGGWWEGLTSHSGLFDSTPLFHLIQQNIATMPSTNRKMRVGTVDQISGKMDIFHENSEHLEYGVLGSCSVPGIFPNVPVTMRNGTKKRYVDGGVKMLFMVDAGVDACLESGYKQEDIIIDMLMCYPVGVDLSKDDATTIDSLMTGLQISSFQSGVAKLQHVLEKYSRVNVRNIIMPDPAVPLPSVGLNFVEAEMRYMYERGMNDTRAQFIKFPQGNASEMLKKFAEQTQDVDIGP